MNQDYANKPASNIPPPLGVDHAPWPFINTQSHLLKCAETQQGGGYVYPAQGQKIGEILKSLGYINDQILGAVEKRHHTKKTSDKPTGELLVYMGIIEREVLTRALCIQSGVLMVDVHSIHIPFNILDLVPNNIAIEKQAIPVGVHKGTLYLAVADPLHFSGQNFFSALTKLKIKPVFSPSKQIADSLQSKWIVKKSEFWAG